VRSRAASAALTAVIGIAAACATTATPSSHPTSREVGAVSAREAVDAFLAAIHAQDLQAMSIVWGTDHGAARDVVNRSELEKREIIMVCFFNHDKASVGADTPGEKGRRIFPVTLTKGSLTRVADFTTVQGPGDRWYVENADILKVRDFCRSDQADSMQFQMVQPKPVSTP
jgi:hypothetical protein